MTSERIQRAERQLNASGNEEARKLIEIQEALKADKKVMSLQARINAAAPGSVAQMRAQYELNRIYLENMSEDERYCTDEGQELEVETGDLYRAIRDARKAMNEATRPEPEAPETEPEDPWKLTWPKALQAIFTGVATFIILHMCCG